ncbi:hypothetical protein CR513_19995, partial [Mucuna pruriens]
MGSNMVISSIDNSKGSTQSRDITLYKTYLRTNKDTNHLFPHIKHLNSNNNNLFSRIITKSVPLPFLSRIVQARKFKLDEELLQTFRKVKINISLLDAIKKF